ncbi:hypothetical protein ASG25_15585 [Rhizobium sp. Leaf384]|uniref:hypothetical protein n=1 Tax=unclassified Rhizobium TaxID=2613769 RepID=UPI0007131F54|nr:MULTISPECIES: hypothetical protein [unclassified Rhizobium]KQS76840.1 hypothetical protein ASG25_15585 [Rhizobium sp. Leaf384]KQS78111.1 hypothetical protein ASG58_06800 [Rhizobium sp. Leaf383]
MNLMNQLLQIHRERPFHRIFEDTIALGYARKMTNGDARLTSRGFRMIRATLEAERARRIAALYPDDLPKG